MLRPLVATFAFACLTLTALGQSSRPAPPTVTLVREVLAEQLGVRLEEIRPDTTFAQLSVDELDVVEIIMELEDRTGVSIPDDRVYLPKAVAKDSDVPRDMTAAKLAAIVQKLAAASPTSRPAR